MKRAHSSHLSSLDSGRESPVQFEVFPPAQFLQATGLWESDYYKETARKTLRGGRLATGGAVIWG